MQRIPSTELLDIDAGSPAEIATSLRDLGNINRWFGGMSTTERMVDRVVRRTGQHKLSLLEVAAGSGQLPLIVKSRFAVRGIDLELMLLDRAISHLNSHRPAIAADALNLPFRDGSFDLVSSSLFVHHLGPPEIVCFANEALRVCRTAVLINDLIRHSLHLGLVYAGQPLFRSRLTRHDTIASVKQAYTMEEMRQILSQTSALRAEITAHYLFRMGVVLWKG